MRSRPYATRPVCVSLHAHLCVCVYQRVRVLNCIMPPYSPLSMPSFYSVTNAVGTNFLVLGSYGIKGKKPSVLGSCTDVSVRRVFASTIIVKDTSDIKGRKDAKTFLVMHDGSHGSSSAIRLVSHVMRPTDTMVVVHCSTESSRMGDRERHPAAVMDRINSEVIACGVNAQQHHVEVRVGEMVSETITHIANGLGEGKVNVDCDFLVLGVDGMSAYREAKEVGLPDDALVMGSVTDSVIKRCRPSVIIAKPDPKLVDSKGNPVW